MHYGYIDSAKIEMKISKKGRKISFLPFVQKTFYVKAKLTLLHFLSEVLEEFTDLLHKIFIIQIRTNN